MSGSDEAIVGGKPRKPPVDKEQMLAWWSTGITELKPGIVNLRGIPIQDLIGKVGFVPTIWLMLRGELPTGRPGETAGGGAGRDRRSWTAISLFSGGPDGRYLRHRAECGSGIGHHAAWRSSWRGGAAMYGIVREDSGSCSPLCKSLEEAVKAELAERKAAGEKFVPGFRQASPPGRSQFGTYFRDFGAGQVLMGRSRATILRSPFRSKPS